MKKHLVADLLFVVDLLALDNGLADEGDRVLPVPVEFQIVGLMVEPGAEIGDLVPGRADESAEHGRRPLHGMAEPADRHGVGGSLQSPAEHGHRVGVVQPEGRGTELFDVPEDVEHRVEGAQEAEDGGGAPRVADVDGAAVGLGDRDIVVEIPVRPAADRGDDAVRPGEDLTPVDSRRDSGGVVPLFDDAVHRLFRESEIGLVDVDQRDLRVPEGLEGQEVPDEIPGEDQGAGADEYDFLWHGKTPFL